MIARYFPRSAIVVALLVIAAAASDVPTFKPVPALPYRVVPDFFQLPSGHNFGEVAGVACNSEGHIFVFQRGKPMLMEFDRSGKYLRELGNGLFDHPHGLRVDADDNIWTIDDGSHVVLKLDRNGRVLLVLGKKGMGSEADWLFNAPTDVAFGKAGEIFVADGYGNSRVVKFDRTGRFLKSWGSYGTRPGEFNLPHSIVVDKDERVYVADRENQRIQIFDADGKFLKEWTRIGYPYGLFITPNGRIWMADGGYNRIVELSPGGEIIAALGQPGHAAGEFAWAHFLAFDPGGRMFVADVLNWRAQVFAPTNEKPGTSSYLPTVRTFWDSKPSSGWTSQQSGTPPPQK
ncbi:MAG: peptidyl-alpha-hydroxyglycine alpha-amidating lyase family protein [Verrucomicrobiota bacterium]|nr:peptidyl-alpha-hydroxyglycine alpha-amidating lyase family protein [Verrucomicrobiota bacterium]